MSTFSTTTGDLSYSLTVVPQTTRGEFSLGMAYEPAQEIGFKYITEQQTGEVQNYGAYAVDIQGSYIFLGNPVENHVRVYSTASGDIDPHFILRNDLTGTGNLGSTSRSGERV